MPDDVTLGEIARGQDAIRQQLAQLVGRAEYEAERRLLDQRFVDQAADIAELKARQDAAEARKWQVWLATFSALLAPIIVLYLTAKGSA